MKLLTKEEEDAHYRATVIGGLKGGVIGVGIGLAAVYAAKRRYDYFRKLPLHLPVALVCSSGTFMAIIAADRASQKFGHDHNPASVYKMSKSARLESENTAQQSITDRAFAFMRQHRYPIVFASWLGSMGVSFALVHRNPYLSASQKLVQARVYAQALTLTVLVGSFALEASDQQSGKGRWQTIQVIDRDDPEHKRMIEKKIGQERYIGENKWLDMIEDEEQRLKKIDRQLSHERELTKKADAASENNPKRV